MVSHTSISDPKHPIESALAKEARVFCAEFSVFQKPRCATTFVLADASGNVKELMIKLEVMKKLKSFTMLCCF